MPKQSTFAEKKKNEVHDINARVAMRSTSESRACHFCDPNYLTTRKQHLYGPKPVLKTGAWVYIGFRV